MVNSKQIKAITHTEKIRYCKGFGRVREIKTYFFGLHFWTCNHPAPTEPLIESKDDLEMEQLAMKLILKTEEIKPMGVIQVGKKLPFNEMAAKQNINLYHLTK